MYELICASTQGSDHIKNGLQCEDFGQVYESEACKIFAVADGHGDTNCPRSQYGAKKACEVAISELEKFCSDIAENAWESRILELGNDFQNIAKQLISSIVAKWDMAVNADFDENPLTEEERAGCTKYLDRYDKGERIEHIYGTTLIAGLLTEKYLLLLQQGDGRCCVFNSTGEVSQPVPWDDRCFANVTTSMCDADAIQRFRYCAIDLSKNPFIACIAGSDGVDDSFFSMDLMHSYYRELLILSCELGVEALNEYLKETLPEFSRTGSGDDVTICGFIDIERTKQFVSIFKRDNEVVDLESKIRGIDERLKSMNGMGKMDALRINYEKACEELEAAEAEFNSAKTRYESYEVDLKQLVEDEKKNSEQISRWNRVMDAIFPGSRVEALKKKFSELKEAKDQAEQRVYKAREDKETIEIEYKEFMEKKEDYERQREGARVTLSELLKSYSINVL